MDGNSKQIPPHVDGETESKGIAQVFSEKYQKLYNSVPSDMDELKAIKEKIRIDLQRYHSNEHVITVNEMKEAILMLQDDKSEGDGVLWSNHITYALASLSVHLSMFLTGIIIHGYNPYDLLMGTIISLPKDKHGNICSSDNYRGI